MTTYWVLFDQANGRIIGSCTETPAAPRSDHFSPNAGQAWLQITEAEWQQLADGQAATVDDGQLVFEPAPAD